MHFIALVRLRTVVFACLCCCLAARATGQKSEEDRTLQSMYQIGLTDSAIAYCERQIELNLDDEGLNPRWTMRLMEAHGQAALWSTPPADAEVWDRCNTVFEDFEKNYFKNPRLPWLAWQQARCLLLRAQANLARYLAAPANKSSRELALQLVRDIEVLVENLEDDIEKRQPIAARQVARTGRTEAPADDLIRLKVDAGLLRCEALLIRSQLYPVNSRDRRAAATDVETQATFILGITGKDWEARAPLEIARAKANLELGKVNEALQVLATLSRDSQAGSSARAAAVAIEYLSANGRASQARGLLGRLQGPELELAKLRIDLAELARSVSPAARDQRLEQLLEATRDIGQRYGAYWRNRAEALLLSAGAKAGDSGANASYDLMIVEVRQLLAAGEKEQAIGKLLEFRDNEFASENSKNALRLASQASALLQRDERWGEAAEALENVALQLKGGEASATAHRQVISCRLQALRKDLSNSKLAELYESSLIRQLEAWPDSEQSDQPQQWLSQWLSGKRRTRELARILAQRALRCQQAESALRSLQVWLEVLLKMPAAEQEQALADFSLEADNIQSPHTTKIELYQLAAQALGPWPESELAKEIDQAVSRLEATATDPDDQNLLAGIALLRYAQSESLSLARRKAASWHPERIPSGLLAAVCQSFIAAIDETANTMPQSWCEVFSMDNELAKRLNSSKALSVQASGLRIAAWLGEESAVKQMETLASEHSRNAEIQLEWARLLAREDASQAEKIAKRIIVSTSPASETHLSARLLLMRSWQRQGKTKEASDAAKLFLASRSWSSMVWKSRFEAIADR